MRKSITIVTLLTLVSLLLAGTAFAAEFPSKPITLIVPWSPGGGTDAVARGLADPAGEKLGAQVQVKNLPGGSGAVGLAAGMSAKADGYTLTMLPVEIAFLGDLGIYPFGLDVYDPIILVNSDPAGLTVRADAKWANANEFIEYAKNHPGEVRIGHSGTGLLWHLAAEVLAQKSGVEFTLVPYDGAAPAIKALLGGELDAVTVSVPEVSAQVKPGNLKILGVMDDSRYYMFPDAPTLKEQGIDVSVTTFRGIGAPAGTPREVIDQLHDAFKYALDSDRYQDLMKKLGYGIAYKNTDDYNQFFGETAKKLRGALEAAGLVKK